MQNALPAGAVLAARGLFAAFFPSECRICDAPLLNISRLPVCDECIAAIHPIAGKTCDICGEALPGLTRGDEAQSCSACQDSQPHFAKATAFGAYDGELRELIHLLKYEQVLPAAGVLGGMLADAIGKLKLAAPVLVVPVPLHSSKRRQRRFNQADLIARAALGKLAQDDLEFAAKVLVRVKPTVSQIGLTRPQRRENMRGAFRVLHPKRVKGRSILLVDDVLTTGTTASECARVLRKAGAEQVWVATAARTLKISDSNLRTEYELETQAS
ncbi:MAG TPA: ComF family protein [Terriglobales bacterium]